MTIEEAKKLLLLAEVVYVDDEPEEFPGLRINLNDTFGWAIADCEIVPKEELPELAELFKKYGRCGVLYWVVKKREGGSSLTGKSWSEFQDINRFIKFVQAEENLIAMVPEDSKRAYVKFPYTLG